MRQVALQMSVTLDGYVAGPGGELDWGLPAEHPDVQAWKASASAPGRDAHHAPHLLPGDGGVLADRDQRLRGNSCAAGHRA